MVLTDTSVWIAHLRHGEPALSELLGDGLVLTHPFVLGELACGNLKNRAIILGSLTKLPLATRAKNDEVLHLLEDRKLYGLGIGWIDAHLLASALLSNCVLWTRDRSLNTAASKSGVKRFRGI